MAFDFTLPPINPFPASPPATPVGGYAPSPVAQPVGGGGGYSAPAYHPSLAPSGGGYGGAPVSSGGGYSTGGFAGPSGTKTDISDTPYAWMLGIPDVANVLNEWQAGGHTDDWLKGHIMQTQWYKTSSESVRNFQQLQAQDPATAAQKVSQSQQSLLDYARAEGIYIDPGEAQALATNAVQFGWDQNQIQDAVNSHFQFTGRSMWGQAGAVSQKLQDMAGQYLVPLSDGVLGDWTRRAIETGGDTQIQAFEGYLKDQAKSLFPAMQAAIDQGITPRQYVDPYVQVAAKELEIAPDSVNFEQPKWSKAINQIDPKTGNRTAMSLADWQTEIRTNSTYGYDHTIGAKTAAADLATQLLQKFGQVGG